MSGEPIAVIHLASGDLWAGAEVQLFQLVTALAGRPDIEVSVVLLNDGLLAERLREAGIAVTVLPELTLSSLSIMQRLVRHLRERKPDVLHTHRQKENVLGSAAAKLAGVPRSLRTVHGAPEFADGGLVRRVNRWLDKTSARFLQDAVVLVTGELHSQMSGTYPVAKCHVIENGIAKPVVTKEKTSTPRYRKAGQINVCFAGRLSPVKRPDLFVATAATLMLRKDRRFHFHLFGDGPLTELVGKQVNAEGLEGLVTLWGFNDDLPSALAEMDILMMTSDHEGLPMVMLEAMSVGVPIVAHATGGMPEVLADGECGVLVRRQDGEGFADALVSAVAGDVLAGIAERARERFASRYTASRCAERYAALYARLMPD